MVGPTTSRSTPGTTGGIHWRQTRNEDQNWQNLIADVTSVVVAGDTATIVGVIRHNNGTAAAETATADPGDPVCLEVVDNSEPGADDEATIRTNATCLSPVQIENGNFQVRQTQFETGATGGETAYGLVPRRPLSTWGPSPVRGRTSTPYQGRAKSAFTRMSEPVSWRSLISIADGRQ